MNQALKHYFLLLKIQFKAMFSMKEVKGENMRKTVGYALLMGFVFIYLAVMVFIFFSAIYSSGLPQQIAAGVTASMLAAFVVASTVINLRSVFGLYGASRDLPFLL